jgi:hypothetical protein
MRLLFGMSKPVLVGMINSLFNENFDPEQVDIRKENAKFVNDTLKVLEGDLFYNLNDHTNKTNSFHIELQTFKDGRMAIRIQNLELRFS